MNLSRLFKRKNKPVKQGDEDQFKNWEAVANKAYQDYNSLSKNERIWVNMRMLIDSFNNGGLISYYYNPGASYVYETLEDLKYLGLDEARIIIQSYNQLLCPNSQVPKDIDERNECVEKIDEQTDQAMEDLETDFRNQVVMLENRLAVFLNEEFD
jgi:hypothetical protein